MEPVLAFPSFFSVCITPKMCRIFRVCIFIFILKSIPFTKGSLTFLEKSDLIKSVSEYFDCTSVIILQGNSDNTNENIQLRKELNNCMKLYTGVWGFETFTRQMFADEVTFPPNSLVVMEYNEENLKQLILMSRKISLAPYDWLLITSLSSIRDFHFKNLIIPINCRFLTSTMDGNDSVVLHEVYRVSDNSELILNFMGNWNSYDGLNVTKSEFWNRRKDLKGHEFKFAVHNVSDNINPCNTTLIDNGKHLVQCAFFWIWNDLSRFLNFTTKYVVIEDCFQNGTMGLSTPMLDMIRSGEADTGEDGYVWSSSRLVHNGFIWPPFQSKVILVTKIPPRKFSFSSYVKPFVKRMWMALIAWLIVSAVVFTIIKHTSSTTLYSQSLSSSIHKNRIEDSFVPFTAICYQGSPIVSEETAIRLAYLMIYIIPVVFIPSYSGSVISSLSVPPDNIPFNNIKEFEQDGTYLLNAINNTFFKFYLMTDDKFETIRRKKLISKDLAVSYEQGLRDICSKRVTYLFEWPILSKNPIHCNTFQFDLSVDKIYSSMAVRKNFPYVEIFNRQMQKLVNSGVSLKIVDKITLNLFNYELTYFPESFFQIKPFGFEDVLPLFIILAVGICTSVFLLLCEILVDRKKLYKYLSKINVQKIQKFKPEP